MLNMLDRFSNRYAFVLLCIFTVVNQTTQGFAPLQTFGGLSHSPIRHQQLLAARPNGRCQSSSRLHFFRQGKNETEASDGDVKEGEKVDEKQNGSRRQAFFDRLRRNKNESGTDDVVSGSDTTATLHESAVVTPAPFSAAAAAAAAPILSPAEQAAALRAQATKARLEAERLDAELTLEKIQRLEREIAKAKLHKDNNNKNASSTNNNDEARVEQLQRDMQSLQRKLQREPPVALATTTATTTTTTNMASNDGATTSIHSAAATTVVETPSIWRERSGGTRYRSMFSQQGKSLPFDEEKLAKKEREFNNYPDFFKKFMATTTNMTYEKVEDINMTELSIRIERLERMDYSLLSKPPPSFTMAEIQDKMKEIAKNDALIALESKHMQESAAGNETELALLLLEYEYFTDVEMDFVETSLNKIIDGTKWLENIVDAVNKSAVDFWIETMYPKCTRKEGQSPSLAQVHQFVTDVLPKASFSVNGQPEAVAGGFIVRGASRAANGDELIEKIDQQLATTNLSGKMKVFFASDFTLLADFEYEGAAANEIFNQPPILYVLGPDVVREPKRVLLSFTSACGIATTWYLSLYPFLLNSDLAQRIDQDLALADANMAPDLSWLTELSLPLFVTYVGIQILHDVAHRVVAGVYGIRTSAPTWVPSIITGITSSVTTFRTPPKNKENMFDYSVAGPLVGMLASIVAVAVGSQLTVGADVALFPALPLEILRQSTLGGGIIEAVLGSGVLGVPEGALGTSAVASMTIPLHPIAVAGYISLIVNALSLLPIGTTDGGRMALALFGRNAKQFIANLFLILILSVGLVGSDLFLFYFAFCIGFQTGNEVPARNEHDAIAFNRVAVATVAYVIAGLSLIPFQ